MITEVKERRVSIDTDKYYAQYTAIVRDGSVTHFEILSAPVTNKDIESYIEYLKEIQTAIKETSK